MQTTPRRPNATSTEEDPVERFLRENGLERDVKAIKDVLREVGISDDARMKGLGRLSDQALEKLEDDLRQKGLDLSARLLVIEGLKRRAKAG